MEDPAVADPGPCVAVTCPVVVYVFISSVVFMTSPVMFT